MTTASTSAVINQTSNANFNVWVQEVYTNLVTNCGLTQTSDTGQLAVPAAFAGTLTGGTAAGYYIFRFNDALQSTSPVFIKLEFGAGSAAADPQMWITVGTGSNGAGTLTGTVTTRGTVLEGGVPTSTTTSYTSRYVYNTTFGYCGMVFKYGASSGALSLGGFLLFRSNDSNGNATSSAVILITNSAGSTGAPGGGAAGFMQCLSFTNSAIYPTTAGTQAWLAANTTTGTPFSLTATLESGTAFLTPVFFMTPALGITAYCAAALLTEAPLWNTISSAIVGATALTFISAGQMFGAQGVGSINAAGVTIMMLWM